MAVKEHCGEKCVECKGCIIDEQIPCSLDCENLTIDGKIKVLECLESECEEIRYIFDMVDKSDKEVMEQYGVLADYPYLE